MTKERKADVMVVAAHPDDAEFGAAGSVARWTREGRHAVYVLCTDGEKGTSDRNVKPEELAARRRVEQQAAARTLGVDDVVFLGYPDQGLEDTSEFRREIVRVIRLFRPDTVVTSDPYRRYLWHRDHRIAGQVVLDAVFPYARDHLAYPDLLEEGFEPHRVREILFWAAEQPNFKVDITQTFDLKLAALHCHKSQVDGFPFADPRTWLLERARSAAQGELYDLAEAFYRLEIPW
jgi:LmbE family N-acetylglucosaminyl deacetylase